MTAFTTYVAESRSKGTTWTVVSEGAVDEAKRHRRALGDISPITRDDLWARIAEAMSRKPYKALGSDLMAAARHDRAAAIDTFIACHHAMEKAQVDDPDFGPKVAQRIRAQAVNDRLGRHLVIRSLMQSNVDGARVMR